MAEVVAAMAEVVAATGVVQPRSPCRETKPSVPCAAMPRKQRRRAAAGDSALVSSAPPADRSRLMLEAMIQRRAERCGATRCAKCWFPTNSSGSSYCVCAKMPPLTFSAPCRFLIYMHPRDWYNAGDDAKLLLCAAPERTEIFIFGRPGDDDRLREALDASEASVLLFPDDAAITVEEFKLQCWHGGGEAGAASAVPAAAPALSVVLIDGTWNNVRRMQKHFSKHVGPRTPHVRLQPEAFSVYARTQTRKDGVSSVEALALLVRELGESEATCAELVRYIEVNNEALRLQPQIRDEDQDD